jgi:prepilin-type N-terminal cleavage/methylation domain-containing protein
MHPNLPQNARRGFSLMELMVVITIIAILSSIIIPAGHAVQSNMKKVQAQKTCTELRTALMSYFTEYKRFPAFPNAAGGGADGTFATDASSPVMSVLLGTNATLNRRSIQFFSTRPAKAKGMPGLYRSADGSVVELLDPFLSGSEGNSNPYFIMIDMNYDNTLQVPSRTDQGATEQIFTNVAVWSYGVDGIQGSEGKSSDDVTAY